MELTDISRRILGQHWRLIAYCAVIVAAVVVLITPHTNTYTATTRLVMDAPDPQTNAETTGISDTVSAIATSPAEIAAALRDAGIKGRNPATMGNAVAVTSLGQSSIVALSVTDRNPHVAAALANALAAGVIRTRLAVTRGSASQAIAQLDQQLSDANQRIVAETDVVNRLTVSLAAASNPTEANTLRGEQTTAARQLDLLNQTRTALESQRISLLSANALDRTPNIISSAAVPTASNPSGMATYLVLGIFLGLIIGIAIASAIETVRPKLVGSDAVAAELHAPLLGTLSTEPRHASPVELGPLALRVRLAGKAAGLPNIRLVAAHEGTDLATFAQWLDQTWSMSGDDVQQEPAPSRVREPVAAAREEGSSSAVLTEEAPYRIRQFDPETVLMNGAHIGVVVVSPDRVAKSELDGTKHLLRVTPGSVLGVVTYRRTLRQGAWDRRKRRTEEA